MYYALAVQALSSLLFITFLGGSIWFRGSFSHFAYIESLPLNCFWNGQLWGSGSQSYWVHCQNPEKLDLCGYIYWQSEWNKFNRHHVIFIKNWFECPTLNYFYCHWGSIKCSIVVFFAGKIIHWCRMDIPWLTCCCDTHPLNPLPLRLYTLITHVYR